MALTSSSSLDGYAECDSAFQHAIELLEKGSERGFMRFVDLLDTDKIVDASRNTLLHWAAAYGCCKLAEFLLSLGIAVDGRNGAGATPLLCAAASCTNPGAMITMLALRGADLSAANEMGDSVVSLLLARRMPDVAQLAEALCNSIAEHGELYTATPAFHAGVSGNAAATLKKHLGTSRLLPPPSPGVNVALNTHHAPQSASREKNLSGRPPSGLSSGRLRSSEYPPAVSSARRVWSTDEVPVASLNSVSGALLYDSTKSAGYCCDAAWWLADSERALLLSQETQARREVQIAYFEAQLTLLYRFFGIDNEPEDVVDNIVAVLGEKFGPDDQRMLLVRWWIDEEPESGDENEPADTASSAHSEGGDVRSEREPKRVFIEDWVPLEEIASAQKVRDYVAKFDRTYSTNLSTTSDQFSGFRGNDDSLADGFGLDESEREELERELGLLPSRRLSSAASSTNRTSLALSQDGLLPSILTPPRPPRHGALNSASRASSDSESKPYMSAGKRAAQLCHSTEEDVVLAGTLESPPPATTHLTPSVPTHMTSPLHTVQTTAPGVPSALSAVPAQPTQDTTNLVAFEEVAAPLFSSGGGRTTRDTADGSQHSFRSGTTLPPLNTDSTAPSVVSTMTESIVSPNGVTTTVGPNVATATRLPPPDPPQRKSVVAQPMQPATVTRRAPQVRTSIPQEDPHAEPPASPAKPAQYVLSDSQKRAYDRFLFSAAMRMLKK